MFAAQAASSNAGPPGALQTFSKHAGRGERCGGLAPTDTAGHARGARRRCQVRKVEEHQQSGACVAASSRSPRPASPFRSSLLFGSVPGAREQRYAHSASTSVVSGASGWVEHGVA